MSDQLSNEHGHTASKEHVVPATPKDEPAVPQERPRTPLEEIPSNEGGAADEEA